MNAFRLIADSTHVIAFLILLYKFFKTKSAAGVSGRTQFLYALVFCTRYFDLFYYFISVYNSLMKIGYITVTFFFIYLIHFRFKETYEAKKDTFRLELLVIPCLLLALIYNEHGKDFSEIMWTASIYLEAVAIVPQFCFIYKAGKFEKYILPYVLFLGSYRGLYILNWIYRYYNEGYYDAIAYRSGLVQTVIYLGFLTYYFFYMKGKSGTKHHYNDNLPEYVTNETLLGGKVTSEMPSVFTVGTKQSYELNKDLINKY